MVSPLTKRALAFTAVVALALGVWKWRSGDDGGTTSSDSAKAGNDPGGETLDGETATSDSIFERLRFERKGRATGVTGGARQMVEGVVVDRDTGNSVAGVDVLFGRGGGQESATSGDDGRFSLKLVGGRYQVQAIGVSLLAEAQPSILVHGGDEPLRLEVKVQRLATVRGRVVDYAGLGVAGAKVHFLAKTPAEKALAKSGLLLDQATTDERGSFTLELLPKDSVTIEARKGYLRRGSVLKKLLPGEERDGLVIELERGVSIRGAVVSPTGSPVVGATISLMGNSKDRKLGQLVKAGERGRFAFEPVAPGTLVLEARAPGFGASAPTRKTYEAGRDVVVTVSLQPSVSISGKVVDSDGKGVGGARIRVGRGGSKMKAVEIYSEDSGSFAVPDLDTGKHWISAKKGGLAIATAEKVRPPKSDLELTLLDFGAIAGRVAGPGGATVDEFVVEILTVATTGVSRPRPLGRSTQFRKGAYLLEDLEPGRYELEIRSQDKTSVKLNLKVPSGDTIRGDVTLAPKNVQAP